MTDRPVPRPGEPRPPALPRGVLIAVAALGALGLLGGWLIVLAGGFHHGAHRYTKEAMFVTGEGAMAMAAICFLQAAIGVAALLQAFRRPARWYAVGIAAVVLPPLVVVLMR